MYKFIAVVLLLTFLSCQNESGESTQQNPVEEEEKATEINIAENDLGEVKPELEVKKENVLNYEIVKKKDTSIPGKLRLAYWLIVDVEDIPAESELRATVLDVWHKKRRDADLTYVYICLPEMDVNSGEYIAAEFTKDDLLSYNVNEGALFFTKWESKLKAKKKAQ